MGNFAHLNHIRTCLRICEVDEISVVCEDKSISLCRLSLALFLPILKDLDEFWSSNFDPVLCLPDETSDSIRRKLETFLADPPFDFPQNKPKIQDERIVDLPDLVLYFNDEAEMEEIEELEKVEHTEVLIVEENIKSESHVIAERIEEADADFTQVSLEDIGDLDENQTLIEDCPIGEQEFSNSVEVQGRCWTEVKEEEYTIEYLETNIPKDEPCLNSSNIENDNPKQKKIIKSGKQFSICPVCDAMVARHGMERHLKTHKKSYVCSLCPSTFANNANRLVHERNSHSQLLDHHVIKANKLLPCQICGKVFMSKYHLQTHTSSHSKVKMYPCDLCGKKYASKSNLTSHKKIHDGNNKVFGCPYDTSCEQRFSHRSEVKQHRVVHTKIKEYKCVHCGNLYSRYPSLWKHTKKCTFNPKLGKPDLDRETSTSFEIGDEEITDSLRFEESDLHSPEFRKNEKQKSIGVEVQDSHREIFDSDILF